MDTLSLSTPQKIAALALFACIIIATVLLKHSTAPSAAVNPVIENNTADSTVLRSMNTKSAVVKTAAIAIPKNSSSIKHKATVKSGMDKKTYAWNIGNSRSIPQIPLNKAITDYEVIEVNQHPDSIPQVGDTVSLPMLHGQKIVADVQVTKANPNGDQSWAGHLQGYGDDYPIIMTYGEHSVFAMITTPEGSYSMESTDGVGWLYKNPSELELSNTNSKDYLDTPDMQ